MTTISAMRNGVGLGEVEGGFGAAVGKAGPALPDEPQPGPGERDTDDGRDSLKCAHEGLGVPSPVDGDARPYRRGRRVAGARRAARGHADAARHPPDGLRARPPAVEQRRRHGVRRGHRGRASVLRGPRRALGRARAGRARLVARPLHLQPAADGRARGGLHPGAGRPGAGDRAHRPTSRPSSGSTPTRSSGEPVTAWARGHLGAPRVETALAVLDGSPVGTAYAIRSDGLAGPCVYLAGVAVVPDARRRGVGAAISSWLIARAFADGADARAPAP